MSATDLVSTGLFRSPTPSPMASAAITSITSVTTTRVLQSLSGNLLAIEESGPAILSLQLTTSGGTVL